jgi:hypothetical protein
MRMLAGAQEWCYAARAGRSLARCRCELGKKNASSGTSQLRPVAVLNVPELLLSPGAKDDGHVVLGLKCSAVRSQLLVVMR